ncbi:MAG: hypothetical protein GX297_09375, partial [Treponema sp.]|nr:hypothetical protein [Treponema sp.]
MINTYNESALHENLKFIYANLVNGTTEVKLKNFICDIVADKHIYEIQTSNLSSLYKKINQLINDYSFTIIFPIAETCFIEWRTENNEFISKRKSPKKENEYRIFKEITKLIPFIDNPNFQIIILKADILETRIKTENPIQLKNNSRHRKKNWYKKDKNLLKINSKIILNSLDSYTVLAEKLLIDQCLSLKDLKNNKLCNKYAGYIIWS